MSDRISNSQRRTGRSVAAILIGAAEGIAFTLATDFVLHVTKVFPPWDQRVPDNLLLVATAYRTIYCISAAYLTAWLAPYKPMRHALIGGALGFAVSLAGTISTWNGGPQFAAHWYPIALTLLAVPSAWLGGFLRERQLSD